MEETEKGERPRKEKDHILQKNHLETVPHRGAFEMCTAQKASEVILESTSFELFCILGNKICH